MYCLEILRGPREYISSDFVRIFRFMVSLKDTFSETFIVLFSDVNFDVVSKRIYIFAIETSKIFLKKFHLKTSYLLFVFLRLSAFVNVSMGDRDTSGRRQILTATSRDTFLVPGCRLPKGSFLSSYKSVPSCCLALATKPDSFKCVNGCRRQDLPSDFDVVWI
jgi:hypothetical protein